MSAHPVVNPRKLPRLLLLSAFVLPACNGGCDEPKPAVQAPAVTPAPQAPARVVSAAAQELEAHLGLQIADRGQPLLMDRLPAGGTAFTKDLLNKRFWLAWGPRGLVANERVLLPFGPLAPGQVKAALETAIPDWQERSGVTVKAALLILDGATEADVARGIHRELSGTGSWRLAVVVLDQGAAVELGVPLASAVTVVGER